MSRAERSDRCPYTWRSSLAILSFCAAISAMSSEAFARATASSAATSWLLVRSAMSAAFRAATSSGRASEAGSMKRRES
jgi:hypothetical protein